MNVAELIEALSAFPADMAVALHCDGDGGVTEEVAVTAIYVDPDVNEDRPWMGEHDIIVPAYDDPVTGYPNRRPLLVLARHEMSYAAARVEAESPPQRSEEPASSHVNPADSDYDFGAEETT